MNSSTSPQTAGARRIARLTEDAAPGAWDWDAAAQTFLVSTRLREIFGFSPQETVDLAALVNLTHAEDRAWAHTLAPMREGIVRRFRIHKGDTGALRWISARIFAHDGEDSGGHSATVEDITDQTETAVALAESEERLRLAIEAGRMAVWEVDLNAQTMTQSPELNLLLGFPPGEVVTLQKARALYNPGELERLALENHTAEAIRAKAQGGRIEPWPKDAGPSANRTQVQAQVAITTRAGVPKHLMLRSQYAPFPDGRPRLTGLLIDITENKAAEEKLATVARELQHRVKNSLSVVYALAMKTFDGKADKVTLSVFLERLRALAAANDLILERSSAQAPLHEVIERIVRPYRDASADPFTVEGPSTDLTPAIAVASGMVLHELCTNAVKYGALSRAEGRIAVRWNRAPQDRIELTWEESGGPAVSPPQRNGFGMRLLENLLSGDGGKVTLDFQPTGLTCRIVLPVSP